MGPPARLYRSEARERQAGGDAHALCNIFVNKKRAGNFEMHSTITIGTFLRDISFYFTNHIYFLLEQNYFKFNKIIFQFFFA